MVGRPRLCALLPPLPEAASVRLTLHAIERYIARCCGCRRVGRGAAARELRELCRAGEVERGWPHDVLGDRLRFQRRQTVIAYVVLRDHDPPLVLPVQLSETDGRPVATTVLLGRSEG